LQNHIGGVFGTAVYFGLALLATKALDLADRHPGDPDLGECVAHIIEFERFDNGDYEFHCAPFGFDFGYLAKIVPS